MIRLGLIGVGAWGKRYIDTVQRRSDCRFVAYARRTQENEPALSEARRYTSSDELFALAARGELDAVVAATSPELHVEIAERAIAADVPALIEKPLGLSLRALAPVLAAARAAAKPPLIVVDYVHLFAPAYAKLKALVAAAGGADAVLSIESEGSGIGPYRSFSSLYDYGTHDLSMCADLLSANPAPTLRSARKLCAPGSAGELWEASLDWGRARVGLRVGNGAASKTRRLVVALSDGQRFVYDDREPHPFKLVDENGPIPVAETLPLDAAFGFFVNALVERARAEAPAPHAAASLEFSLRIAEVLDAVAAAAEG